MGALLDINPATMRNWIEREEVDSGARPGVSSVDAAEIKALRKENAELRRANEILKTCYVALLTDVYSRQILGWRVTTSKTTPLVMSALEQALFTRRRADARFTATGLMHHSDYAEVGVKRPRQ